MDRLDGLHPGFHFARRPQGELGAEVTFVEGRPKMYGTPWLMDPGSDIPQKPGQQPVQK